MQVDYRLGQTEGEMEAFFEGCKKGSDIVRLPARAFGCHKQDRRERGQGGAPPPPRPISCSKKNFFHVKLENIHFLHVNNMRDFSLFIEQEISDKK